MIATHLVSNPLLPLRDLARWGLLEIVRREQCLDHLLVDFPLPEAADLVALRGDLDQRLGLADGEARARWLESQGLSEADFDAMAARSLQWLRFCQIRWGSQVPSLFLAQKASLDGVTYSLLRMRDGDLIKEIYLQIREGEESLAKLAAIHSEGPERQSGGLIGPQSMAELPPALARLLQVSEIGQLWSPRQMDGYWLIVRLEAIHGAVLDGPMREQLLLEQGELFLRSTLDQPRSA